MFDVIDQLNWLAIALATFAYFILGALWFTPLFGNVYDTALGVKRQKNQKWPPIYYVGPFVSSVVATIATAVLVFALDVNTLSEAITLGLVVGVGYALSVSINNAINPKTPRPLLYGLVTGGYHVVGITLVSAILFGLK